MRISDWSSDVCSSDLLALVCDSTNVFNAEASGSESSLRAGLLDCVASAPGRVLVTTFASNAARLKTLGDVARETGRTLCVAGRSLDRILRVARQTGYLRDFPEVVDFDKRSEEHTSELQSLMRISYAVF